MLEYAWSPETAYQGITYTPEDPPSRGQCGVSSLWLARFLVDKGVDAMFTEGIITIDGRQEDHVWVEVVTEGTPYVVDLTSDQYATPNGALVHIGQYESDSSVPFSYKPEQYFESYEVPRKKLLGRLAILEQIVDQLPRRYKRFMKV